MPDPTDRSVVKKSRPPRREPQRVQLARHLISSRVVRGTFNEADPEIALAIAAIYEYELFVVERTAARQQRRVAGSVAAMNRWVKDVQMFQRIGGITETSRETLEAEWRDRRS